MKVKKLRKKLSLNKETVTHLQTHQLKAIKGGACTCANTGCNTNIFIGCGGVTDCGCRPTLAITCFCETILPFTDCC
ncbi:MAG: rSAM-modified peptide [bacterium]|nr:rSAM-modified peptide [bacterium]